MDQAREVLAQTWSGWKVEVLTKQTGVSSGGLVAPALISRRSVVLLLRLMLTSVKKFLSRTLAGRPEVAR